MPCDRCANRAWNGSWSCLALRAPASLLFCGPGSCRVSTGTIAIFCRCQWCALLEGRSAAPPDWARASSRRSARSKRRRHRGEILRRLSQSAGLTPLLLDLQRLARAPDDGDEAGPTIVICLDQAEELATVEGGDEAETFLTLLADGLNPPPVSPDARTARPLAMLVAGIRSDSFERFQIEPSVQRVPSRLFNLPPISPSEFKSVIEGPAARSTAAGKKLVLEPALTERLLQDTQGQDALPLLAFTLERLYLDHGADGDLRLAE